MKWTDTHRIAEELFDTHGESIDPHTLRFTQLRDLVLALPDFDDDPARCGEKIPPQIIGCRCLHTPWSLPCM